MANTEEPSVFVTVDFTDVSPDDEPWRVTLEGDMGDDEEYFYEKTEANNHARELMHEASEMGHLAQLLIYGRDGSLLEDRVLGPGARSAAEGAQDCEPTRSQPKLTRAQRDALPDSAFAIPEDRSYPLRDKNNRKSSFHAELALTSLLRTAARHGVRRGDPEIARRVLSAVRTQFPSVYKCERDVVAEIRDVYGL